MSSPGLLLVISGPSGVGKTTIVQEVIRRLDAVFSVSATTRDRTAVEVEGRDYFFVDETTFQGWIDEGRFLEFAQVFGRNWYGTPRAPVEEQLAAGRIVVLDIDVQGALQVRRNCAGVLMLFVLPPNETELLHRLRSRGRDDEAAIQRRFAEATREIATARESNAYDAFVVNDDLARAVAEVIALVHQARADSPRGTTRS